MHVGINVDGLKLDKSEVLKRIVNAIEEINVEYGDSIALSNVDNVSAYRVKFQLIPLNDTFRKVDVWSGRQIHAVCYHGHLAFMVALFRENPETVLRSTMASWDNIGDFILNANDLAYKDIGSPMYPAIFSDACKCRESGDKAWHEFAHINY